MHTSVGATSSMHTNARRGNFVKGALEFILDGSAVKLALPTGERPTVIRKDKLKARRHSAPDPGTPAKSFGPLLGRRTAWSGESFFRRQSMPGLLRLL